MQLRKSRPARCDVWRRAARVRSVSMRDAHPRSSTLAPNCAAGKDGIRDYGLDWDQRLTNADLLHFMIFPEKIKPDKAEVRPSAAWPTGHGLICHLHRTFEEALV